MTGWRYIAERLNGDGTADPLDIELPLKDVSIEENLSNTNGLSGTIEPSYTRLLDADGLPILREWSTAIYAEKDGEIRGGGILTHSGFQGPKWTLECAGFSGYAKDMPYTGPGAFFIDTDVLDIVRYIWNHLQSQDGGNLGLEIPNTLSGIHVGSELTSDQYDPEGGPGGLTLQTQAYKLAWYADHDLESNIQYLAQGAPFDYREKHFWDGDTIRHTLEFGVPRLGDRRPELRCVLGENIFTTPSVERDGAEFADEVYVLGAGEGAKMIRGHAYAPRTRLRRVAVVSDSSIRKPVGADMLAQSELRWRNQLDDFTSVLLRDHPNCPIGALNVGDEVYLQGKTDWVEIGAWCKVLTIVTKPESPDVLELTLIRSDRLPAPKNTIKETTP